MSPQKIKKELQNSSEVPPSVAFPLDTNDLIVLKTMVDEYKSSRLDFSILPRRPRFKGGRVNTGIALNAELKNRAVEKAKSDPDNMGGGNLSGLVELLLWVFLGCPKDIVQGHVSEK